MNRELLGVLMLVGSLWHGGCGSTATPTSDAGAAVGGDAKSGDAANAETGGGGHPCLTLDPPEIDWGVVHPNTAVTQIFTILNKGNADLVITAIEFTAATPVFTIDELGGMTDIAASEAVVQFAQELRVPPGTSRTVGVTAKPTDDKPKFGKIKLINNQPSGTCESGVKLLVNTEVPCLHASTNSIDFGPLAAYSAPGKVDVELESCGTTEVCIESIALTSDTSIAGEFTFDFNAMSAFCPWIDGKIGPTAGQPCCLPPTAKTSVLVKYAPIDASPLSIPADPTSPAIPDTAVMSITSGLAGITSVALSGSGTKQVCPAAAIQIPEGNEVIPQTVLHLKGGDSKGMGGAPVGAYKWTVKQPAGSTTGFAPSSSAANPTFQPTVAGEYEFCLEVIDENGISSCVTTCETVVVVPNNAVHIELLWATPGDVNNNDVGPGSAANLDLHFANYLAFGPDIDCDGLGDPWFNTPFDCFWKLPDPQWGSSNTSVKDDPKLAWDNDDGPEFLNLDEPEGTPALKRFYSIGVHYWNDNGYGTSYATITVALFGAVVLKVNSVAMAPLDMWYVGKLNWPNTMSGTNDPPLTVCYQSGDACATGKMWQSKGDPCITPCYVHPSFSTTTGGSTPPGCQKP